MSAHRYDRESARAAGLKGLAARTPEQASAIGKAAAQARWAGHERKSARAVELPAGPVRTYWVEQVAARYPDEFGAMSAKAIVRRATLLARQAAAQAAVQADKPAGPALDGFAILRAARQGRVEAGERDE